MGNLSTIILRHCKENLRKCSLRGLENDPLFLFFTYPKVVPKLDTPAILLTIDAPLLSREDHNHPLFLIDGTWKYAALMQKAVTAVNPTLIKRSLPATLVTAYPRKQTGCEDPERGLASIEALYVAHLITGKPYSYLLDNYYWKDAFLEKNRETLSPFIPE